MQPNIVNTIHRYREQIENGEVITIVLRDAVITLQPGQNQAPVDVFVDDIDEGIDLDKATFMEKGGTSFTVDFNGDN